MNNDLISRQAAIKATWKDTGYTDPFNVMTAIRDRIEQLPSAEPKRIRGHWIPVTNGRGGHECDLCHEYAPSFESGNEYLSRFCPNCGADMREVTT